MRPTLRPRRSPTVTALFMVGAITATACTTSTTAAPLAPAPPVATTAAPTPPGSTVVEGGAPVDAPSDVSPGSAPGAGPEFAGTTTTAVAAIAAQPPVCPPLSRPVPTTTTVTLPTPVASALADLHKVSASVGLSVTVDGREVVVDQPDAPLVPASNQKLLITTAVLETIPLDDRLTTTVVATGPTVDGIVHGDLVLVAGGDPAVTTSSAQSLDSLEGLAAQLPAHGITGVDGRLVIDDSRYDTTPTAPGWPDSWGSNVGALSALIVDRNRGSSAPGDATFFTDPGLANGRAFAVALKTAGVTASGPVERGVAPAGVEVAKLSSPPIRDLVALMLMRSDNLIAETLVKELGRRRRGQGTTAAGLDAAREVLAGLCIAVDGHDADGSGLSRGDAHSARMWRQVLAVAMTRPWWPALHDALPVAGQSGTLAARLLGGFTAGNVRAKTGAIAVAKALSGYLTTTRGHAVVFSIILNTPTATAEKEIDAFVTALTTSL